jgi:hypothetical protein
MTFTDLSLPASVLESCGYSYTLIFTKRPWPPERDAWCTEETWFPPKTP